MSSAMRRSSKLPIGEPGVSATGGFRSLMFRARHHREDHQLDHERERVMNRLRNLWGLLKEAAINWYNDNTFLHGAALAYYTVFSLAPTLIIAIGIASFVFKREAAEQQLLSEVETTFGAPVAKAAGQMLE